MIRLSILLLLISFSAFAQDTIRVLQPDSTKVAYVNAISTNSGEGAIFIAAGSSFTNGFKINRFLEKAGIVPMESTELNLLVGVGYYDRRIDIDAAFETFINGGSNQHTRYKTNTNGFKFRAFYQVIPLENYGIGAGFNIGWSRRKLQLFWKDHSVDFSNPDVSGNQLTMFLEKPYVGPAIYFKMKGLGRRDSRQLKLTLAYEWGFNNKKWESDYIELENDIYESGHGQLVLNVSVYL